MKVEIIILLVGVIVARQALTLKEEERNLYQKPRTLSMQYMIGMRVNNGVKHVRRQRCKGR